MTHPGDRAPATAPSHSDILLHSHSQPCHTLREAALSHPLVPHPQLPHRIRDRRFRPTTSTEEVLLRHR